jgi:RNA polymerase sigma factor for flagellar operon FliA
VVDITPHVSLAERVASAEMRRLPSFVDPFEIKSVAYGALMEAGSKFDPNRAESSFDAYAQWLIKLRICDYVRREHFKRNDVPVYRALTKARNEIEQETGRLPSPDEARLRANVSIKAYRGYAARSALRNATSLDVNVEDEGGALHEVIPAETEDPSAFDHKDIFDRMKEALHKLPDKLRTVAVEHFLKERTLASIAKDMGITESRVCQLSREAVEELRTIFSNLEKKGVLPLPYNPRFLRVSRRVIRPVNHTTMAKISWTDEELKTVVDKFVVLYKAKKQTDTVLSLCHRAEKETLPSGRWRCPPGVEAYGTRFLAAAEGLLPGETLVRRRNRGGFARSPAAKVVTEKPAAPVSAPLPQPKRSATQSEIVDVTRRILESIDLVTRSAFAALGVSHPPAVEDLRDAPEVPTQAQPLSPEVPAPTAPEDDDDEDTAPTPVRKVVDFTSRKKMFVFGVETAVAQQFRESILTGVSNVEVIFISPQTTVPRAHCDYAVFVASSTPTVQVEGARVQFGSALHCVNKTEDLVSYIKSTDQAISAAATG